MEVNAIDRLFVAEALKKRVDQAHRRAKEEAEEFLAAKRDEEGATGVVSLYFGPDAGEYKYGSSRAKQVVEWNEADPEEFGVWLDMNNAAARRYAMEHAADLAEWWFGETGEVPDGIARVDYEEPPRQTPPKIYRYDEGAVLAKLSDGGNALMEANRLLLGDAS